MSLLFNEGKGINDIFYIFDPVTKKASGKVHLHATFIPDPNPPPVVKQMSTTSMSFNVEKEQQAESPREQKTSFDHQRLRPKDTPHFGADAARTGEEDSHTTPFFEDINKTISMVDIQNGHNDGGLHRISSHAVTITEQVTPLQEEAKESSFGRESSQSEE